MTIASGKNSVVLTVWPMGGSTAHRGRLLCQGRYYPCALGRTGITAMKREGDGATPLGDLPIRAVYYRPDRWRAPLGFMRPLDRSDGWCDDPASTAYNRQVKRPFVARHEEMWRSDHLYDVVVVLGHNDAPPRPGRGSAIFLHLARSGFQPTEGCVAVEPSAMRRLLGHIRPGDTVRIARDAR